MIALGISIPAKAAITDGLVGHYKLDGDATDSSPSANNATEVGGPTYAAGKIGQAISLNGSNQSADAGHPPGLEGASPKTIAVWFNQAAKVTKSIVSFGGFSGGGLFEVIGYNGNGSVVGHFYGANFDTIGQGNPIYNANQWHHAALTYDGTTVRVYLDGQFANQKDLALGTIDASILNIGSGFFTFFNGMIDDVGLWNRELKADEIQAIYASGLSGKNLSEAVVTPVTALVRAPLDGAMFVPGGTVQIDATATPRPGSSITKVEFFAGTTKLGEDLEEPYSFTWENVPSGRHSLTVKATDNQNVSGTSPAVNITATPAATVQVSSPADNASFASPANITLEATVNDPAGDVAKVGFYQGATLLGEDTTAPYSFNWQNVTTRSYSITAKATDKNGVSSTSAPVKISVLPPEFPGQIINGLVSHYKFEGNANDSSTSQNHAVEIGGPTYVEGKIGQALSVNGIDQRADAPTAPLLTGNTPQSVSLWFYQNEQANDGVAAWGGDGTGHRFEVLLHSGKVAGHFWGGGYDTIAGAPAYNAGQWYHTVITYDGAVVKVYLDGQFGNQLPLALDISEGPLHLGSGEPDGGFTLYSYFNGMVDDVGLWNRELTAGEVAAIYKAGVDGKDLSQAKSPPQISLTSPVSGTEFQKGANVTLEANVSVATGSTVAKVEFFAGSSKIGEDTTFPYSLTINAIDSGRYTFTARATDNQGDFQVSAPVNILVRHVGPVTPGLTRHYKLDGNANDSTANAQHGTELGAPTYVEGPIGQALSVNGVDQRIDAPSPGLLGNAPQSLSLWFNQTEASNDGIVAYGADGPGSRFEALLHSGRVAGHFYGGGFDTVAGGPPYVIGQWYHMVITYDGAVVRVYVNGQYGNEKALGLNILEGPLHIGSGEPDGNFTAFAHFYGMVDDVGLWNRAIGEEEVAAIYAAGQAGSDLSTARVENPQVNNPQVTVSRTGNTLVIAWPETASGFVLEATPSLNPAAWAAEGSQPVTENGMRKVTVNLTGGQRYFRLRQ